MGDVAEINARLPPDPNAFTEAGATGLKQYSGYIREEFHRDLEGTKGVRVYREMADNDAAIGGALLAIETLIRRVEIRTNPAEKSGAAGDDVAEFVDQCRTDMETRWSDFMSEALTMLVYGWDWHEMVFKVRRGDDFGDEAPELRSKHNDGKIGWRNFAPRSQDTLLRWEFAPNGRVLGMWQQIPTDGRTLFIHRKRSLLFRPRSHKNNPEGRSLLRSAYRSWYYLKRIQELEAIGIERRTAGLPHMQVPVKMMAEGATVEDKAALATHKKLVENVRKDQYAGIVTPCEEDRQGKTGFKFGLVTTGGDHPSDVDVIVKRLETRILMSFLAEFLPLGVDGVGSLALSSDKTAMFAMAIASYLGTILEEINDVAIPLLCYLNNIPRALYPTFTHGDIEKPDIEATMRFVAQGLQAGVFAGGRKLETHMLELGDLPIEETNEPALVPIVPASQEAPTLVPATPPPSNEEAPASETALNGAQVTAAKEIVVAVANSELPRDSGVSMLVEFFNLDPARAERIMGSVGRGFEPAVEPAPASSFAKGRADEPDSHNDAHNKVQNARAAGEIEKKPCELCGDKDSEAHHSDYSKPLMVKWLCRRCHSGEHAK